MSHWFLTIFIRPYGVNILKTKVTYVKSLHTYYSAPLLPFIQFSQEHRSCLNHDQTKTENGGNRILLTNCILMGGRFQCHTTYSIALFRIYVFPVSKMFLAVPQTFYYTGNMSILNKAIE